MCGIHRYLPCCKVWMCLWQTHANAEFVKFPKHKAPHPLPCFLQFFLHLPRSLSLSGQGQGNTSSPQSNAQDGNRWDLKTTQNHKVTVPRYAKFCKDCKGTNQAACSAFSAAFLAFSSALAFASCSWKKHEERKLA